MNKIKIKDSKNDVLSFDLFDILKAIENLGESYNWAIFDIYLTSKHDSNLNVLDLEKKVNSKEMIFAQSFSELLELSSKFLQVIDGTFIGSKKDFPKVILDVKNLEEKFDIVIEAIDSNHWTVYSTNNEIIEILQSSFNNTTLL